MVYTSGRELGEWVLGMGKVTSRFDGLVNILADVVAIEGGVDRIARPRQ